MFGSSINSRGFLGIRCTLYTDICPVAVAFAVTVGIDFLELGFESCFGLVGFLGVSSLDDKAHAMASSVGLCP